MATARLLGTTTEGTADATADTVHLTRYQALGTGKATEFKVYTSASGQVKVAVYADNAGEPGDRLVYNDTAQNVVAGWNTLSIPEFSVVKDTYYWLAINGSVLNAWRCFTGGSETKKYKAGTFSTWTWPSPLTGLSSSSVNGCVAGWGVLVLSPSSIEQPLAYGTPTVQVGSGALIIYPSSIAQPIVIGTPALIYPQILSPQGIAVTIVFGTPSVGVYGIIRPAGIEQLVAIGSPSLLKYVWHVILDGQYIAESPDINRAYVIGRDANGNPVYGEAHDSAESSLVGERLDFIPDPAIPTTAQAGDVASAVLSKMRLTGKRGVILIPPNCGQELFDVVQISDAGANQSAVTFRVVGLRFEYNPKQARYQHRLVLGAP